MSAQLAFAEDSVFLSSKETAERYLLAVIRFSADREAFDRFGDWQQVRNRDRGVAESFPPDREELAPGSSLDVHFFGCFYEIAHKAVDAGELKYAADYPGPVTITAELFYLRFRHSVRDPVLNQDMISLNQFLPLRYDPFFQIGVFEVCTQFGILDVWDESASYDSARYLTTGGHIVGSRCPDGSDRDIYRIGLPEYSTVPNGFG